MSARAVILLALLALAGCGAAGAPDPRADLAPPAGSLFLEEDW